jgi:hypothetical protein
VSDDVVAALADVTVGPPANRTIEVAGPERFHLEDLEKLGVGVRPVPSLCALDGTRIRS